MRTRSHPLQSLHPWQPLSARLPGRALAASTPRAPLRCHIHCSASVARYCATSVTFCCGRPRVMGYTDPHSTLRELYLLPHNPHPHPDPDPASAWRLPSKGRAQFQLAPLARTPKAALDAPPGIAQRTRPPAHPLPCSTVHPLPWSTVH